MFLKLPFAVSFSVLFITIQYAVFRKSFRTFYVSLYIYIYIPKCGSIDDACISEDTNLLWLKLYIDYVLSYI